MAKFCSKNLKMDTNESVYFGDSDQAQLFFGGAEFAATHTISGTAATADYHLIQKGQVDSSLATLSGVLVGQIITDHGSLIGLTDDDHTQYVPTNADRGFTATVSGIDPTSDYHLSTKKYVDDEITNNVITDHGGLTGLGDDDHTQYILATGFRAFTGTVSGIDPTAAEHLTTKQYVDGLINGLDWQDSVLSQSYTDPTTISGGYSTGDRYIIDSPAAGAWIGNENSVAEWNGVSWDIEAPNEGFAAWVEDEDIIYVYNGTAWVKFGSTVTHANLIGLDQDDHPQYHNDARGDARYYTQGQVDTISGAIVNQIPSLSGYATESYVDNHNWYESDILDLDKYTTAQVDTIASGIEAQIITDHGALTGLADDDHSYYVPTDGSRGFTATVSGIDPIQDYHLATKWYIDNELATVSGGIIQDHGGLTGLGDDDHTQYSLADGSRDFSNIVSYNAHPSFTTDTQIVDKKYVDDELSTVSGAIVSQIPSLSGYATESYVDNHNWYESDILDLDKYTTAEVDTMISGVNASIITDHGLLSGLTDDDHLQYVPTDASRGFTATVSGVDPIQDYHLTTKSYVDSVSVDKSQSGRTLLAYKDENKVITFPTPFADTNYSISAMLSNIVDAEPGIYPMVVSAKSTTGFTLIFSGKIDSANYYVEWIARHD